MSRFLKIDLENYLLDRGNPQDDDIKCKKKT